MATPQTIISAIVAPFTAAAEIATAIDTVATLLDGARSVVLIVDNTTHHDLELVSSSHDHGGFDVTPATILPKLSTAVFSSKDKGLMTGTEGRVRYRVKDARDDEETLLDCSWANPFVGNNRAAALAFYNGPPMPPPLPPVPIPSAYYRTTVICGAGDQKAEMRYTLLRK